MESNQSKMLTMNTCHKQSQALITYQVSIEQYSMSEIV